MVPAPLVPAAQCLPGGVLGNGLFVIVSGETATASKLVKNVMEVTMTRAILRAQQAGTAKSADCTQAVADLSFLMTPGRQGTSIIHICRGECTELDDGRGASQGR
jgi:hypothetical protein